MTNPLAKWGGRAYSIYRYDHTVSTLGSGSGQGFSLNLNNRGILRKMRPVCLEQMAQMNTPPYSVGDSLTPGNGIERMWVDGRLGYERTDVNFVQDDMCGISDFNLQWYWGGTDVPNRTLSCYMSQVVIATDYIGPMRR